jgi:MFS superfamily sulfate permease-like transporter
MHAMKRLFFVFAGLAFLFPFGLIGGLLIWLSVIAHEKAKFQNFGMKVNAQTMFMMDLAMTAETFFPLIAGLAFLLSWALAVCLVVLGRRKEKAA